MPSYLTRIFGEKSQTFQNIEPPEAKIFRTPKDLRIYAIGDIHGCVRQLRDLAAKIREDIRTDPPKRAMVIGLGDYVDRGPHSKNVIDALVNEDLFPGLETIFLKGNHEVFLIAFLNDPVRSSLWLNYGGRETLQSYGVTPPGKNATPDELIRASRELAEVLPKAHSIFFLSLALSHVEGDYFFAHAGIDPGRSLDDQREEDLTGIRSAFLNTKKMFKKCVVHGHTPVAEAEFLSNRVNVDTGVYLTGKLTAAVFENEGYYTLSSLSSADLKVTVS